MTKDYYKILDIPEFSSYEDVKSAYRKLARKWHPDIAGNEPNVIAKFKEINEAYQFLSNDVKKSSYDKSRKFYSYASSSSYKNNTSYNRNTSNPNYKETTSEAQDKASSFWRDIFAQTQKEDIKSPKNGENIFSDIEISIFEATTGATKTINMLQSQVCPICSGKKFVDGHLCSCCKGKGDISEYKRFNVKIPAGIKNNSKIRLAGQGEKGKFGGRDGDLYLTIHITENKNYTVEGLNILKTIPITPFEAILGANILIATIVGNVNLKLTPNTDNGQKIRLAGCGIKQNNKVGDMIVTVEIQTPKNLSDEEILLYKRLKEISSINNNVR